MANALALEVVDLCVQRERERVLAGVTFSLAPGRVLAVVGPNGCGKSTLLAAILGEIAFTGTIRRAASVAYVPQRLAIDRSLPLTVRDFLATTRQRRPVCFGVTRGVRAHVDKLLDDVGLAGFARRPLAALSGGETQRVLLAHAIDPAPALLLLDEPSSALDEASTRRSQELVKSLARDRNTAVVVVSHDRDEVKTLADEVLDLGAAQTSPEAAA